MGSPCSALRLSQPLDGLLLPQLCGLISCRYHVQGFTLQGFSLARSRSISSMPLCPLALALSVLLLRPDFSALQRIPASPELQGLSSARESVSPAPVLPFTGARSPHGLCASSRSSPLLPWRKPSPLLRSCPFPSGLAPLLAPTPRGLRRQARSPFGWTSACCRAGGPACLFRELPTCLRFVAADPAASWWNGIG
jgi:hypothetical protein